MITILEPVADGSEYAATGWPLHVTIADTFAIDLVGTDLLSRLTELLSHQPIVETTAADDEYFGTKGQTQVTMLDMSPDLIKLHLDVFNLLISCGAVFNDPQYQAAGYRAHVTVQPHVRLNQGGVVVLNNLCLIDMFPGGNPQRRQLVKTIRFSAE